MLKRIIASSHGHGLPGRKQGTVKASVCLLAILFWPRTALNLL